MDCNNYSYTNDQDGIDGNKFKPINKNWSFKKKVEITVDELWKEGDHLYNWEKNVRFVAWEIIELLDDDPSMSFETAYNLVMDY